MQELDINVITDEDLIQLKVLLLLAHGHPLSHLFVTSEIEWGEYLRGLSLRQIHKLQRCDRATIMALLSEVLAE